MRRRPFSFANQVVCNLLDLLSGQRVPDVARRLLDRLKERTEALHRLFKRIAAIILCCPSQRLYGLMNLVQWAHGHHVATGENSADMAPSQFFSAWAKKGLDLGRSRNLAPSRAQ